MALAIPGPSDVVGFVGRVRGVVVDLLDAIPSLLGRVEALLDDVTALLDRIEQTRLAADGVVERVDATRAAADELLVGTQGPMDRLVSMLDVLEPPLTKLQPTIERLADTTDPKEVDALVSLIDKLPMLVDQLERDVLPMLESLGSVAPDLHDLLDVSRELNEMLGRMPGMKRVKRRVDEEQAARGIR